MLDIDLNEISMVSSKDMDLTKMSHVRNVEKENKILRLGLITCGVIFVALVLFQFYHETTKVRDREN
jgi:hypothetical protein